MEIETISDDIVVEFRGAKFTFHPASHQDLIYAMSLLDYLKGSDLKVTAVDKDTCISHVFSKLKALEGVSHKGINLDAEAFKLLAPKAKSKAIIPIVSAWAADVVAQHGLLEGASAKNEQRSDSSGSSNLDSTEKGSTVEAA